MPRMGSFIEQRRVLPDIDVVQPLPTGRQQGTRYAQLQDRLPPHRGRSKTQPDLPRTAHEPSIRAALSTSSTGATRIPMSRSVCSLRMRGVLDRGARAARRGPWWRPVGGVGGPRPAVRFLAIVGSFLIACQVPAAGRPGVHAVQITVEVAVGDHDQHPARRSQTSR